jgi:hypothetical protein
VELELATIIGLHGGFCNTEIPSAAAKKKVASPGKIHFTDFSVIFVAVESFDKFNHY